MKKSTNRRLRAAVEALETRSMFAAGAPDPTFGNAGLFTVALPAAAFVTSQGMAVQSDGKYVAAGVVANYPTGWFASATRFNANGTIDTTFGTDGLVRIFGTNGLGADNIAIKANGKIIIGGFEVVPSSQNRPVLIQLNSDGSLDNSFDSDGILSLTPNNFATSVLSLKTDASGRIIFTTDGTLGARVVRLLADGTYDTSFNGTGVVDIDVTSTSNSETANDLEIDSAGRLVIGGTTTSTNPTSFFVARLLSNGTLDSSFDSDGLVSGTFGATSLSNVAISIRSTGDILLGAAYGSNRIVTAQLLTNGAFDPLFGTGGQSNVLSSDGTFVHKFMDMAPRADGRIVVATNARSQADPFDAGDHFGFFGLTADGQIDSTFRGGSYSYWPSSAIVAQSNRVVLASSAASGSGLIAINSDGTAFDQSFGRNGTSFIPVFSNTVVRGTSIQHAHTQSDGKIVLLEHQKTTASSSPEFNILSRLTSGGKLDPTFGFGGSLRNLYVGQNISAMAVQSDDKILLAASSPTSAVFLARKNADGFEDISFGSYGSVSKPAGFNAWIEQIVPQADGTILIAGRSSDQATIYIARLLNTGALDTTFATNGIGALSLSYAFTNGNLNMTVDGQNRVIVVANNAFGTIVFRLTSSGQNDLSFNSSGYYVVEDFAVASKKVTPVVVQPDGKIVVATAGSAAASPFALTRINTDGTLDRTFNAGSSAPGFTATSFPLTSNPALRNLQLQPDGSLVLIGTAVSSASPLPLLAVAQFTSAGLLDSTFGVGGRMTQEFPNLTTLVANSPSGVRDGRILIAGTLQSTNYVDSKGFVERLYSSAPVSVAGGPYTVNEYGPVTFDGSSSNAPGGSPSNYEWDFNYDGTFDAQTTGITPSYSSFAVDGPLTRTIALRVTGSNNQPSISTTTLQINNVAPTATFFGQNVLLGTPAYATYTSQYDPSSADTAAGFKYWYDFNNDGDFDDVGDVKNANSTSVSRIYSASGTYTVRGRIYDKDNAFTEYFTTITVSDKPIVSIVATDAIATETGTNPGKFTISRSYATSQPLTVNYTIANNGQTGYGTNGTDYTAIVSNNITIPANQTSVTIDITPKTDAIVEGPEKVEIAIFANSAYTIAGPGSATVTLYDTPTANAGGPYGAFEAGSVQITGGGSAASPTYEWDYDYVGGVFTTDFVGQSQILSGAALDKSGSRTIAFRVSDPYGQSTISTGLLTVSSVPPTATLSAGPAVTLGSASSVAFSNQNDVSAEDRAAGYTYSYDFNYDGDFTDPGDVLNSTLASASYTFASAGTFNVRARIADKDEAYRLYTTQVTVNPATSSTVTLPAAADAYVRDGTNQNTNYGALATLEVKKDATSNYRETFLKFDISSISSPSSAKLRLFGKLSDLITGGLNVSAYSIDNTTWTDASITYANRPTTPGALIATANVPDKTARWIEWDLTSYVQSQKSLGKTSIALVLRTATGGSVASFNSLNATSSQPQLVVSTGSVSTPQALVLSTNSLTVNEGSNNNFTVKLATAPSADISVLIGKAGDTDLSSAPTTLTFTAANWNTPQTVTLSAAEDSDSTSGSATFTLSAAGVSPLTVTATEADNDSVTPPTSGTISPVADATLRDGTNQNTNYGSLATLEVKKDAAGNYRETYLKFDLTTLGSSISSAKLRLFGKLSDAVTGGINVSVYDATGLDWSDTSITYANRPTASTTVLASAVVAGTTQQWIEWDLSTYLQAQKSAGKSFVTLALKTATGGALITFNSRTAATNQPQLAVAGSTSTPQGIVLSTTSLSVNEGSFKTFTVKLAAAPTSNVVVTFSRHVSGDADLTIPYPGSITTFTSSNWNIEQTITLTAAPDPDSIHGTALFHATSSGLTTQYLTATEIDDDGTTTTPVNLNPLADATVRDGTSQNTNYGSATTLEVKKDGVGSNRETYLKFDLTTITNFTSAKLRLYGKLSDPVAGGINVSVYDVSNTAWVESTLTYANRPASATTSIATANVPSTTFGWIEWDLTSYLTAQKAAGKTQITLALKTATSGALITFNSLNAATNKPVLSVT